MLLGYTVQHLVKFTTNIIDSYYLVYVGLVLLCVDTTYTTEMLLNQWLLYSGHVYNIEHLPYILAYKPDVKPQI